MPDEIPRFTTTGTHKSGNTWLVAMLFELEGVEGYSTDPRRGLPVILHHLLQQPKVASLVRDFGVAVEALVERLIRPPTAPCEPLVPAAGRTTLVEAMEQYVERLRYVSDNFLDQDHQDVTVERLVRPLLGDPIVRPAWCNQGITRATRTTRGTCIVGCPAKHLPAPFVSRVLPGWKIVQLLRDPRDVLVSAFYHGLGTLSPQRIERLTTHDDFGRRVMRPDWRRRCFSEYVQRLARYYDGFPHVHLDAGRYRTERYEDLRADPVGRLTKIWEFLAPGGPPPPNLETVVRLYAFDNLRGRGEQRNSFVRKAAAGDWRWYFDRAFADELGRGFAELVTCLGYEPDDGWIDGLPDQAPREFDFRRFRPRMSAATVFRTVWMRSPELRERYPRPLDVCSEDCFAAWLRTSGRPEVDEWFRAADELADLWEINVAETVNTTAPHKLK